MKQKFKAGDKVTPTDREDYYYGESGFVVSPEDFEGDVAVQYGHGYAYYKPKLLKLVKEKQPSLTISILPVKGKTPSFRFQFKSKNGEVLNDKYVTKGNALRAVKKLIKQIQENDFKIVK